MAPSSLLLGLLALSPQTADTGRDAHGWRVTDGSHELRLATATLVLRPGERLLPMGGAGELELSTTLAIGSNERGTYRFTIETEGGTGELSIGSVVTRATSDWLDLDPGPVELSARFRPSPEREARLRVLWERKNDGRGGFPPEPVPSRVTTVRGAPTSDASARLLLERKGCTNCHLPSALEANAVERRAAPDLANAGARLSGDWMRRWIRDPEALHAQADMPRLDLDDAEVEALVHFLGSLRRDDALVESGASEKEVLAEGRLLYHTLGCVACHDALAPPAEVFGDDRFDDQLLAVPVPQRFGDLSSKWIPSALAGFLHAPEAIYPDGRMPSLDLSAEEADLIATYLVHEWGVGRPLHVDRTLATRGRELFAENRCGACHRLDGIETPPATALAELGGADCAVAHYALADDKDALARGLASARAAHAPSSVDATLRTLERLNCLACHALDGEGGRHVDNDVFFTSLDEHTDLGDEGRLPPDLSGVGWKLTSAWLRELLLGKGRSRPYLATRMPSYAKEHVSDLVVGLAHLSGVRPDSDLRSPESSDAMVVTGRALMGRDALGCLACHVYGDYPPSGSPGPAITQFAERLRYEWFRSFMRNPQRYRPGSRMPDFGIAGLSTLDRVYEGDMQRQLDAMWAYFELGEFMPLPDSVELDQGQRLVVGERPMVMRCFLESAGSRAIAVGTPLGVHYAFDARLLKLVEVWQGDFLDPSGSWSGRGGNTLGGRGTTVWSALPDEEPPLRLYRAGEEVSVEASLTEDEKADYSFGGYRLDADGAPTFLFDAKGCAVELEVDLSLTPRLSIERTWRIRNDGSLAIVILHAEKDSSLTCLVDGRPGARYDISWVEGEAWYLVKVPEGTRTIELVLEVTP